MSAPAFQLITALRYDRTLLSAQFNTSVNRGTPTPFLLLSYHVDRLHSAGALHGGRWPLAVKTISPEEFERACTHAVAEYGGSGPFKVRFALAIDGSRDITVSPVPALPSPGDPLRTDIFQFDAISRPAFQLYLDTVPTPTGIYTRTKTTRRAHYDAARSRHSITLSAPNDVLLYNESSRLSETSIRNVALRRSGRWVTPADTSGCLEGVVRRWLVEQHLVRVDDIGILTKDTIENDEIALVFNAVEGCRLATVRRNHD